MNFMKINLEIKNKILILIYKINIYGSLNNNQKLFSIPVCTTIFVYGVAIGFHCTINYTIIRHGAPPRGYQALRIYQDLLRVYFDFSRILFGFEASKGVLGGPRRSQEVARHLARQPAGHLIRNLASQLATRMLLGSYQDCICNVLL